MEGALVGFEEERANQTEARRRVVISSMILN